VWPRRWGATVSRLERGSDRFRKHHEEARSRESIHAGEERGALSSYLPRRRLRGIKRGPEH
jgi:hypothetical protein